MAFESFNTVRPEENTPVVADNSQATTPTEGVAATSGTPPVEATPPQETKPDEFIDKFNTKFSTQYKSEEEIKSLFSLTGKVSEYEGKLKDFDKFKTDADKYKKELEDTKTNYVSDFLSKPLLKQAFVASQLQEKYPDRDKNVLAELAMSDIDKIDDLEIIARERKMDGSKSSVENIKAVIKKGLGIDPEQKPEEWDDLTKTELEIKATDARKRIKQLLSGIELPKVVTKEEREATLAKALDEKKKQAEPFKEIFKKFDTYKNGDFEFTVPDEFKSKTDDLFENMFVKGGLDINEGNLATAELIKKALFVEEYLPKMLEVRDKVTLAKAKEETDKLLHNDQKPNTTTATDIQGSVEDPNRPGVSKFFQSGGQERATKL